MNACQLYALVLALSLTAPAVRAESPSPSDVGTMRTVRLATFNASLNHNTTGQLVTDLSSPTNAQARGAAAACSDTTQSGPAVSVLADSNCSPTVPPPALRFTRR
jgi:hypothetical protein